MTAQPTADVKRQIAALRGNLSDATNPRILARSPQLGRPEVVARIRAEIKRLEETLRGATTPAVASEGPADEVRVADAYRFSLGDLVEDSRGVLHVFMGWGQNTRGRLPIFVAEMQGIYPSTAAVRISCPVTEGTLLKNMPGAIVYRIPGAQEDEPAPSKTERRAPARKVAKRKVPARARGGRQVRPRVEHVFDFTAGCEAHDRRGRTYIFQGWKKNSSGKFPSFTYKKDESTTWEVKSAFADTLLRRLPDVDAYRRPE